MEAERVQAARADANAPLRQAAVMLILHEREGAPWVLLTKRTERVADHKGQISFPGGSRDPGDASLLEAALREVREELGVEPSDLRVVGGLAPVLTVVTRYVITPFVAYAPRRPDLRPDAFEVAEVIDAPLSALLDPTKLRVEEWDSHGVRRDVYFYEYGKHVIWGATARILRQLLEGYTPEWWRAVTSGSLSCQPPADTPPAPA